MRNRIYIFTIILINCNVLFSQRLEFSGNFLTPGYTINTGLGFTLKKQINISFGASYLINNSIKFRGSTINYFTAYNERFIDRVRGCYMRFEESIINKPKYQLNLMQFLNFQQSDRARIAASPYGVIGDNELYLYERKQENNLYYLEY